MHQADFFVDARPVYRFSMPVIESNMYMILVGKSCLTVDPCVSEEARRLLRERQVKDCLVLLTHEHYDHISGVNWLRGQADCQVVCSKTCAERIRDPKKNAAAYFHALFLERDEAEQREILARADPAYACCADTAYADSLELAWNGLRIALREAPGHSPGSQIIRVNERHYFTGDYLIPGEPVITRLPGGSRRQYEAVTKPCLQKIAPDSTVFPGHGTPGPFSRS